MSLESLTGEVRMRTQHLTALGYRVKFDVEPEGPIMIDGTMTPVVVSNDEGNADCTIRLSAANLDRLLKGDLSPTLAYTLGQIKIDGSLGVAMKLASMLDS